MKNTWFARKQNGDVITLTEIEALTHFEQNNVANRMRLTFLGTSDGSKMRESHQKASDLIMDRISEQYPTYASMSKEERGMAKVDVQTQLLKELKEITTNGYNEELEQAKKNGVKQPDKTLRIITKRESGDAVGSDRDRIINSMM